MSPSQSSPPMHRIQALQCVWGVIQTALASPSHNCVFQLTGTPPHPPPPLAGQVLEQTHASEGVCVGLLVWTCVESLLSVGPPRCSMRA